MNLIERSTDILDVGILRISLGLYQGLYHYLFFFLWWRDHQSINFNFNLSLSYRPACVVTHVSPYPTVVAVMNMSLEPAELLSAVAHSKCADIAFTSRRAKLTQHVSHTRRWPSACMHSHRKACKHQILCCSQISLTFSNGTPWIVQILAFSAREYSQSSVPISLTCENCFCGRCECVFDSYP